MVYSYFGASRQILSFNNMLKKKTDEDKRIKKSFVSILEADGIYAGTVDTTANLAGELDMCAYLNPKDVIEKADIIFIFLDDEDLKKISDYLGRFNVRDKIFCHFSPAYTAKILDFSPANTYISMYLPYLVEDNASEAYPEHIIASGYGRRLADFKKVFTELGIDCSFVSPEEKLLCLTAVNMVREMPAALTATAQRLVKYALATSPDMSEGIRRVMSENPHMLNGYDAIKEDNEDFALTQCQLLANVGLNDITKMYISLLKVYTDSFEPTENRKRVMRYTMENL